MSDSIPALSKSKFTAGLQCLKRLWLTCYRADEAPAPDAAMKRPEQPMPRS